MKRVLLSLTCLTCLACLGASAADQAGAPVAISTGAAAAPEAGVQPSTAPAWVPGRGDWDAACDADVGRFCPGLTSREQVRDCLVRNRPQLSPACQQVVDRQSSRWPQRVP